MTFEEALKLMKTGERVKLPSWGGFWYWDDAQKTIMMQCQKENGEEGLGPLLDIRETDRVEYTISNILSDDWIVATKDNTPVLGGVNVFDYDTALDYLKKGHKLKRLGWSDNIKGIELVRNIEFEDMRGRGWTFADTAWERSKGGIYVYISNGHDFIGYELTDEDKTANDWTFSE